jgi:hypothetical protein
MRVVGDHSGMRRIFTSIMSQFNSLDAIVIYNLYDAKVIYYLDEVHLSRPAFQYSFGERKHPLEMTFIDLTRQLE